MLHRPYLRKSVRQKVMDHAPKNEKGQFLDPNTGKPIEGKINYGHKYGHEYWREAEKAEKEGLTQKEFNDRMNNPKILQIEDEGSNKSHAFEMPRDQATNNVQTMKGYDKGEKTAMQKNEFLESIKADKATISRCNEVSKNAAKSLNSQSGIKVGSDNGGRERGDTGPMSHGRESGYKSGLASSSPGSSSRDHSSNGQGGASGHSNGGQSSSGQNSAGGHGSGGQGGNGGHGSSGCSGGHGGH